MSEKSEQPTEEPTARRWEKAFEEGQLAFSSELIGGLIILAAMFFFWFGSKWFFDALLNSLRQRLTFFEPMISHPNSLVLAIRQNVEQVGLVCLGFMLPLMVVILLGGVLQTRFNLSSKPLNLDWKKISPQSGLKRIFSTRSLNRGLISIAKATAVILAGYFISVARWRQISLSGMSTFGQLIQVGAELLMLIGFATAVLLVVIGALDLAFQIWKQKKDLMMTKQEVREENKDSEGDPQIRARIRKLQSELARKKVVQEVPKATVVITNPTHYAVALRFEPGESGAPVVIAKGSDHLAKQIIRVAKEHGIAVVERKPVARFLYAHVKVGREIPVELYRVVAEILNFIKRAEQAA
jgi:flagellar biosynthetic protein FlhB